MLRGVVKRVTIRAEGMWGVGGQFDDIFMRMSVLKLVFFVNVEFCYIV